MLPNRSNPLPAAATAVLMLVSVPGAGSEPVTIRGATLHDHGVVPAHIRVDMARLPEARGWLPGDPIKEMPQRKGVPEDFVPPLAAPQPEGDPLLDRAARVAGIGAGRAFDVPTINTDGATFSGVQPPDPVGDVGRDHYVQMINGIDGAIVRIRDKADGALVRSFTLGDLALGSGTGCTTGRGDPIVLFDQTVSNDGGPPGRWLLSEFTSVSFCVYISRTADPTAGTWYLYEFASDSGGLPDYPKYAVWPDAYYIGSNENGDSIAGVGRALYALDRQRMLDGLETRPTQVFEAPLLDGFGFQILLPADWDGTRPPPAGTPGLFVRHVDDEVHDPDNADTESDYLELWRFAVDWDDPAASTLTGPAAIGVADFESETCGVVAFSCVPQPDGGVRLDPLREPMMWRVQYRNFGSHETLVGSWMTDVAGGAADLHGVRWAELRETGAGWTLLQQGTISPDDTHRWMSSIASDGSGNLAVGYNVSDGLTTYPGLRYTGRRSSDPSGTMPVGEVSLVEGFGVNTSNRYGDYSSMNVDPDDDCTFWFTGEYNPTAQWRTRIGAFRFPECGGPALSLNAEPSRLQACIASGSDALPAVELQVARSDAAGEFLFVNGFETPVARLAFSPALPAGLEGSIAPDAVFLGNEPAGSLVTLEAFPELPPGSYAVGVSAVAPDHEEGLFVLELDVAETVPGAVVLLNPADGAVSVSTVPVFDWSHADGANGYVFELAGDAAFTDVVTTALVTATRLQLSKPLAAETEFHWRVRPRNQCGLGSTVQGSFTTEAVR